LTNQQVEVEFGRMPNIPIDHGSGRAVAAPVSIPLILREETHMVALANHNDGDRRIDSEFLAGV